jgi:hypothetical protein
MMRENDLRAYRDIAAKAVRNPERAYYKVRESVGAVPARFHSEIGDDRPPQADRIEALRTGEEYLLVVLDACRYDVFADVAPEYLSFDSLEPVRSAGHNTFEYVSRCWPDTYEDVEYVSAATPVNSDSREAYEEETLASLYGGYVPAEHIPNIRDVWRESWDESIGITPPSAVTDAAVEADGRRVVAHYFQPHAPYIGRQSLLGHVEGADARPNEGEPVDAPVWSRAKAGDVSRSELRAAYESNLRRALREVRRLVAETDVDRIAVVGDHGEALGEYGIFGHPSIEHPYIRTVPWGVVDGVPEYPDRDVADIGTTDVESRLADLGYLG